MFRLPMASTSSFEFFGCTACCCCTGWSPVDWPLVDCPEFAGCWVFDGALLGSGGQSAGFWGVGCCVCWPCVVCVLCGCCCAQGFCGCSRTGAGLSDCAKIREGQAANPVTKSKPMA